MTRSSHGNLSTERAVCIDRALAAVLEAVPEARHAALDDACGDDAGLRREVEAMLCDAETPDSLLRSGGALSPQLVGDLEDATEVDIGQRAGRYRILRPIGRGGMGRVYLAERADGQFEQRVAVKVLHLASRDDHLARFHRERQILARLEHPNIARLIDGGTTEQGQPYLVMEYVEGQPIDRYCRERRLPLRGRVGLLITVCRAVQAAHRQLIVHRDLKPANILVSAEGQVKLLDFGIARILAGSEVAVPGLTVTGGQAMTPQYASPEQIQGEPVTVASDVYQLGLLAYELLAGHRPYTLSDLPLPELLRRICEQQPEPPSAAWKRAADEGSAPGCGRPPGDLDLIVLRALRKAPEGRYGSAAQLGEDLERFVDGRPVAARPATRTYRLSRFLRRHALAAGLAAAALVTIVGLSLAFTWNLAQERDQTRLAAERAEHQRALAEERRQESEAVIDFLAGLFENADPFVPEGTGEALGAVGLLERGAESLEEELAGQPLIRARLLHTVGTILSKRGRFEPSVRFLEQAVALRRGAPEHRRIDLAGSLKVLGSLYLQLGREEAGDVLREALQVQEEVLGAQHPRVAMTLLTLANLSFNHGRYEEAERESARALAVLRQQPERDDYRLCVSLVGHGSSLSELRRFDEALVSFREAGELGHRTLDADHPLHAVILQNIAVIHARRGEHAAAVPFYRQAFDHLERVLGPEHHMVAQAMSNLAGSVWGLGRLEEAEELLRRALEIHQASFGPSHLAVAANLLDLADLESHHGRPAEAESLLRRALGIELGVLPESHPVRGIGLARLGAALLAQDREAEAEVALGGGLEILEAAVGKDREYLAEALLEMARLEQRRDAVRAESLYQRALAVHRDVSPPGSAELREAEEAYATFLSSLGRDSEAASWQCVDQTTPPPPGVLSMRKCISSPYSSGIE